MNGVTSTYPTIEAIIDALKPVYDATMEFQSSNIPMIHQFLPVLQHMISELSRIECGGIVKKNENGHCIPSLYSMHL